MTALIPASLIRDLTKLDESAMPDVFTVTTITPVDDGAGSSTETETETTTKGRLWSLSGDELGDDQLRAMGKHRIAIPKGTSVSPTARITHKGKDYNIKYVFPLTEYSTSLIIGVEDA